MTYGDVVRLAMADTTAAVRTTPYGQTRVVRADDEGLQAAGPFRATGFPIVIAKFWGLRNDPAILPAESFSADSLSGLSLGYRSSCQRHIAVARGT